MPRISLFLVFAGGPLFSQHPLFDVDALRRAALPNPVSSYNRPLLAMIENRARTLGNEAAANGTRYFAVRDIDLRAKTSSEIVARLAPTTIRGQDRVRRVEVVVDIQRPLRISPPRGQALRIGTVTLDRTARNISVRSNFDLSGLTVTRPK